MSSSFTFPVTIAPLFVFMVTFSLIWWLIKGSKLKILDRPNSRSLHAKLGIAQSRQVDVLLLTELLAWLNQHPALSDEQVKIGLTKWVPEYSRKEAGSDR
jgi:hypothetical protein